MLSRVYDSLSWVYDTPFPVEPTQFGGEQLSELTISILACEFKGPFTRNGRGMCVASTVRDQSDLDQLSKRIGLVS